MDFWIEHHRPRRGNPLWLPLLFVIARIVRGCPYYSSLYEIRAGTGACPYGPPRVARLSLGQPPVVARLFVIARFMVPNQGRHGGLPLRSTPRWGNPLWLPVGSPLPVLWCQIRAGTGACPYGPPRVGATPCGCPFVRRSTESGQARGPAHTVHPAFALDESLS